MASKKKDSAAHFFGTDTQDTDQDLDLSLDTPDLTDGEVEGEIAIDVYQTNSQVVIVSPIAGVDPEDIEISAADDTVTISCKRHAEHTEKKENLFVQEIYWGNCSRTVQLPAPCLVYKATADYKHGVLTVKIPKTGSVRKKVIKVKAA